MLNVSQQLVRRFEPSQYSKFGFLDLNIVNFMKCMQVDLKIRRLSFLNFNKKHETHKVPPLKSSVLSRVIKPVSYTHLDVYKRQQYNTN